MLYYNTTTDKRYNERTLSLYGFTPDDHDIYPLTVTYPEVDDRFETYRDTQEVYSVGGTYHVRFEVVPHPHSRIVERVRPGYLQQIYVRRQSPLVLDDATLRTTDDVMGILVAWKSAVSSGIPFEPSRSPFIGPRPELTVDALSGFIDALQGHYDTCHDLVDAMDLFLNESTVETLKETDPAQWVVDNYSK